MWVWHDCRLVFFFSSRSRHTRWPRDWSSDVCSSDLVDRGGEATWHGPGQLVLYPILHIQEQEIFVSDLVRGLAGCIRDYLQSHAIESHWDDDHPGIWVDDRKIAAVGMRIQRGVSRHGAALNLTTEIGR